MFLLYVWSVHPGWHSNTQDQSVYLCFDVSMLYLCFCVQPVDVLTGRWRLKKKKTERKCSRWSFTEDLMVSAWRSWMGRYDFFIFYPAYFFFFSPSWHWFLNKSYKLKPLGFHVITQFNPDAEKRCVAAQIWWRLIRSDFKLIST